MNPLIGRVCVFDGAPSYRGIICSLETMPGEFKRAGDVAHQEPGMIVAIVLMPGGKLEAWPLGKVIVE